MYSAPSSMGAATSRLVPRVDAAAHAILCLEQQHGSPAFAQTCGRREPRGPGADHDYVILGWHEETSKRAAIVEWNLCLPGYQSH